MPQRSTALTLARGAGVVSALTAGALVIGAAAFTGLNIAEAIIARQRLMPWKIPNRLGPSGLFGSHYDGDTVNLALLGDSLAVGVGADSPTESIGVGLARGLADAARRPVRLSNAAVVGGESLDLASQIDSLLDNGERLEVVVIVVGGNEILHSQSITSAVEALAVSVGRLHRSGCHVIVATCPDLGTIRPFSQPLRFMAHLMSRYLATAQTFVTLRAGGRTVSLADTLGEIFREDPAVMFSPDHLHPSSAGYARAIDAMLPSVRAAAAQWTGRAVAAPRRVRRTDRWDPLLTWLARRTVRRAEGHAAQLAALSAAP